MNDLAWDAASSRVSLSREDWDLAVTYGIEARLHHSGRAWTDIHHELAAGWARMRGYRRAHWQDVAAHVEAAWHGAIRL
ncbi:hypothetical protein [Lysobacter silvisoli]|uniref:Uncharacterized protein n=1 Tax=Lysobacter silvisoli TaxID=2293254 RepID=A0A371JXF7_9GAMM|nr:hypothetical protein [Lysobacter silvisoli]RDZ26314.1 hypothetical protein DX914_18810 [Lysobacter silvisoli]